MGLIKAAIQSLNSTLADQWKEFFYCDSIDSDILVMKGQKRTNGRSSNKKGNDNIISSGSVIAVADGQCMIIVEQGKIVEFCAEPGEFVYDASSEPSLFTGDLADSLVKTFDTIGRRFTFGGDTGKDQRIYYFNTKEITDNKFGTATPFLFRVVDRNIGFDREVSVRCNGIYSYRITNPLLFYANVCGNIENYYDRSEIDPQLKTEFIGALQPAFARLSELELRPSQIPAHSAELEDAMNKMLTRKWSEKRGISIVSVAMNPISLKEEDLQKLQQLQDTAILRNASMRTATLTKATAEAMKAAASNANGSMMGFMGMNMVGNATGMNLQNLFEMDESRQSAARTTAQSAPSNSWRCSCGHLASGNFCTECGSKKPETNGWTCSCGTFNKGKFCYNCGAKKSAGVPLYRCDKCGWEPEDPTHPPKFCPECGDPFGDEDIIK